MAPSLFDPKALELVVQRHLAEAPIPEGKRGVFLTVGNSDSLKAVVAVRAGNDWQLGAFVDVERQPDEHWGHDFGVFVRGTF